MDYSLILCALLLGESVPVTKTPLPHTRDEELFCPNEYKRHVLFCGTHVLQTRYYGKASVKAAVIRTGESVVSVYETMCQCPIIATYCVVYQCLIYG